MFRLRTSLLAAVGLLTLGCSSLPTSAGGFSFRHHFIDRHLPGESRAQTALADLDRDGHVDYITSQTRGPVFWCRQEAPARWIRHTLGNLVDWVNCIQTRGTPKCSTDEAFIETATFLMSLKSQQEQRMVWCDAARQEIGLGQRTN